MSAQAPDRPGAGERTALGTLRSPGLRVVTDDGIDLHVEVDDVAGAVAGTGVVAGAAEELTLVFVHGYSLNLDCWHFQRAAYRGRVRTVFYDQRSHGRSQRSAEEHCTIDQLGRDLRQVVETAAPGPVVLVGHSMGGMSIISMAEQFPELFGTRVVGVSLIATTAGGLDPGRILFPMVPMGLGGRFVERVVRSLDRGHLVVDRMRSVGHGIAEIVTSSYSFGAEVPKEYVDFTFRMIDSTPFEVVADFFPAFATLDKFDHLEVLAQVPCMIICGTEDRITGVGHSRKLHARIHGSDLHEVQGAGHMVLLEAHDEVNRALDELVDHAHVRVAEQGA